MAQYIKLQGVVDTGAPYNPRVPRGTAREITCPRLADTTVEVCVVYPGGGPVMVGSAFTLGIRDPSNAAGVSLTKVGTFANGVGIVQLTGDDTRRFCASRLMFDAWLTVQGKKYQVVAPGVLRLSPNVVANP